MAGSILHVLDGATPADLFETLALVIKGREARDHVVALGHRSTADLAAAVGMDARRIQFIHSMGWADPTGWFGLRRIMRATNPECIHAWGIPAAVAVVAAQAAIGGKKIGAARRMVSLADLPAPGHLRLLPMIHKGTITGLGTPASPCTWIVTNSWLKRELHSHSIAADAVTVVRLPAIQENATEIERQRRREMILADLELQTSSEGVASAQKNRDGPVLLLGGDGGAGGFLMAPGIDPVEHGGRGGPRHDLGMWTAAILQQIFPRIRAVVRADPRGRLDAGFERLNDRLPDEHIVVPAPAEYSWRDLLAVADALLVTPDGPFTGGCILQAFAAGVPVIGTPVESVREYITDGSNGMLATSTRPRAIAAAVEAFFTAAPETRGKIIEQARRDAAVRYDPAKVLEGYAHRDAVGAL